MNLAIPAVLAAFPALVHAIEFRQSAELALEGKGAIYALELPSEAYRGIERRDLGDLRVLNGAGEVVPHALERQSRSEKKESAPVAARLFPVLGARGRPVEDLNLRVERRPDGSISAVLASGAPRPAGARRVVAYVLDASATETAIRELRLDWDPGPEGGSFNVRVEASDDLRAWRAAGRGPILVLRHGEALLERRAIEIAPQRAKYLRLSWAPGEPELKLKGATVVPVDAVAEASRAWMRIEGSAGAKPGEHVFELPPGLPVDRLRIELPQENTVAQVSLVAQERPGGPERTIGTYVLYRMEHRGEKLVNPELAIGLRPAGRWVLRVDPRGGGIGSGAPVLNAGWVPHRLIFVARGEPPFRLAFGNAEAPSAAIPVQSLVPGYSTDKPVAALAARIGAVTARKIAKPEGAEAVRAYVAGMDRKKLWLWGSLLLAVAVIVGMALRLSRQMPAPGEKPQPRPPYETR
jgi:hypothetical protein